jgi:hypothetical protein
VGSVKFPVDGSLHEDDQHAGTGMTIRDQQGGLMFTAYRFVIDCEPPSEAKLARSMNWKDWNRLFSILNFQLLLNLRQTDCSKFKDA